MKTHKRPLKEKLLGRAPAASRCSSQDPSLTKEFNSSSFDGEFATTYYLVIDGLVQLPGPFESIFSS